MPLLLLTTTGARTGQRRATPLTYLPDGDRYVVAAANGGAPSDPAWYHNVVAHPQLADYQAMRAREVPIVLITPYRD